MKKAMRCVGIFLLICFVWTMAQPALGAVVSPWAIDEISAANATGLFLTGADNYLASITRGRFCALVAQLLGRWQGKTVDLLLYEMERAGHQNPFTDTQDPYVLLANYYGIVDGMGDGTFRTSSFLTREQAAKILTVLARTIRPDHYGGPVGNPHIADVGAVSAWALPYVRFVMTHKILQGVGGGHFQPQGTYTVEQAIVTCYRLARVLALPGVVPVGHSGLPGRYGMTRTGSYATDGTYRLAYAYAAGKDSPVLALELLGITVNGILVQEEPGSQAGLLSLEIPGDWKPGHTYSFAIEMALLLDDHTADFRTDIFTISYY